MGKGILYRKKLPDFLSLAYAEMQIRIFIAPIYLNTCSVPNSIYGRQRDPHSDPMGRKPRLRGGQNSLAWGYTTGPLLTRGSNPGSLVPWPVLLTTMTMAPGVFGQESGSWHQFQPAVWTDKEGPAWRLRLTLSKPYRDEEQNQRWDCANH